MTDWIRKDAEICRMSCQKVAAELMKFEPEIDDESLASVRKRFVDTVDWLVADVVAAGDRAVGVVLKAVHSEPITENGSAVIQSSPTLNDVQQEKMVKVLKAGEWEVIKLKLWELQLPNESPEAAAGAMTVEQGKTIAKWLKERKSGAQAG